MSEERDVIIGGNLIAVCPSTGKSMTIRIGLGNVQFIVRTDKEDESTERLLTAPWAMPRRHGDWDEALRMIGAFAQDYLLAKEERKEGVVVDFLQAKRERESGGSVAPTDKVRSTLEELGYDPDEPVNPAVDAIIEEALAGASEDDDDLDELFSPPKPLDWDAPVDCSRDFDHQVYFYVDGKLERKVEAPYHLNDSVLLVPGSRGGIGSFVLDSVAVPDCHRIAPWVRFVAAPKIQTEPEDGGEYNPLSLFDPTTDTLIIAYGDRNADDLMFTAYAEIWTAFE